MPHGWKKEHKETGHPKPIQMSKSDHRIQIILTFCISILFFLVSEEELPNSFSLLKFYRKWTSSKSDKFA